MSIQINKDNLNTRATALKTVGESFTPQRLNVIDTRSTISVIQNSINAQEATDQIHLTVGEYLVRSSTLIKDIGERFFKIDEDASGIMAL